MTELKQYLGDSVYADMEGSMIKLTTEDGISVRDTIFLEPEVLEALNRYYKWVQRERHGKESQD